MSTDIFEEYGVQITEFCGPDNPTGRMRLAIHVNTKGIDPRQARDVGLALLKWASENGAHSGGERDIEAEARVTGGGRGS